MKSANIRDVEIKVHPVAGRLGNWITQVLLYRDIDSHGQAGVELVAVNGLTYRVRRLTLLD